MLRRSEIISSLIGPSEAKALKGAVLHRTPLAAPNHRPQEWMIARIIFMEALEGFMAVDQQLEQSPSRSLVDSIVEAFHDYVGSPIEWLAAAFRRTGKPFIIINLFGNGDAVSAEARLMLFHNDESCSKPIRKIEGVTYIEDPNELQQEFTNLVDHAQWVAKALGLKLLVCPYVKAIVEGQTCQNPTNP